MRFVLAFTFTLVKAASSGNTWTYEGSTGPAHWADKDRNSRICAFGEQQSPVNLNEDIGEKSIMTTRSASDFDFNGINNFTAKLKKLERGLHIEGVSGQSITYRGEKMDLSSIHFHVPSEHHMNNRVYPMEIQFYFGTKLAIALFGDLATANTTEFMAAVANGTSQLKDKDETTTEFKVSKLFKEDLEGFQEGFLSYPGSLTIPPCTEGVRWVLSKKAIKISIEQYQAIASIVKFNARPLQERSAKSDSSRLLTSSNLLAFSTMMFVFLW